MRTKYVVEFFLNDRQYSSFCFDNYESAREYAIEVRANDVDYRFQYPDQKHMVVKIYQIIESHNVEF